MDAEAFSATLGPWMDTVGFPHHLVPRLLEKLRYDVFDIGNHFTLAKEIVEDGDSSPHDDEEEEEAAAIPSAEKPTQPGYVLLSTSHLEAGEDVWLVDHSYTFSLNMFRPQLEQNKALCERIEAMIRLNPFTDETPIETIVNRIYATMWPYIGSYSLPSQGGGNQTCFFFHDEVGSAVRVSTYAEEENMQLVPLPMYFADKGCVFSVLWCTAPMKPSDVATRCPVHKCDGAAGRRDIANIVYGNNNPGSEQYVSSLQYCTQAYASYKQTSATLSRAPMVVGTITAPVVEADGAGACPITFYCDNKSVAESICQSHSLFVRVLQPSEAKLMWMSYLPARSFRDFSQADYVIGIPGQDVFTNLLSLVHTLRSRLGDQQWMPVIYNGSTETVIFTGDYIHRQNALEAAAASREGISLEYAASIPFLDESNAWVLQDAQEEYLSQSLSQEEVFTSSQLEAILRVVEAGSRGKSIAKVMHGLVSILPSPDTRARVYLRWQFIVGVRNFGGQQPGGGVEAYVHHVASVKKVFCTPYSQSATEGSVCYCGPVDTSPVRDPAVNLQEVFNTYFEQRGIAHAWEEIAVPQCRELLRSVFTTIFASHDHLSNDNKMRFRGLYGVDVAIHDVVGSDRTLHPVLLGISAKPDMEVIADFHPHIYNDILTTLVLGRTTNMSLFTS